MDSEKEVGLEQLPLVAFFLFSLMLLLTHNEVTPPAVRCRVAKGIEYGFIVRELRTRGQWEIRLKRKALGMTEPLISVFL